MLEFARFVLVDLVDILTVVDIALSVCVCVVFGAI